MKKLLPMPVVNELFARFAAIYKSSWTDTLPTRQAEAFIKHEWAMSLADFTKQQIDEGIERCKDNLKWPPSIAEFRQFVLSSNPHRTHHEAYKTFNSRKALPRKANSKIAEQEIDKMRKILGMKKNK